MMTTLAVNAEAQQVVGSQLPAAHIPQVVQAPAVNSTASRAHPGVTQQIVQNWPVARGQDWITQWCNDVLFKLRLAREQAREARYRNDDVRAVNVLIEALQQIDLSDSAIRNGPFTAKAVARGVELYAQIGQSTQNTTNATATMLHWLFNYYGFVEFVAQNLDVQYFWQHSQCAWCSSNSLYAQADNMFEMKYKQYVARQIEMVLRSLAGRSRDFGTYPIYPIGSGEALLSALQYVVAVAAEDLSVSIYNTQYACMIQELNSISSSIVGFQFSDWPRAVAQSYVRAERIVDALNGRGASCYSVNHYHHSMPMPSQVVPMQSPQYPQYSSQYPSQYPQYPMSQSGGYSAGAMLRDMDLNVNNLTLSSGDLKSVAMDRSEFIQQVIVQAQGLDSSDSLVAVVVNGIDKGTLFVPHQADPSYVVTVAATTGSIEFRHKSGGRVRVVAVKAWSAPYNPVDQQLANAATESYNLAYGSDVRTLQTATTVTVRMDGARYTRSLVVDAEGIDNSDSIVEVIVNGAVKQTLYVPRARKDPSYIVTVADTTEAVVLRHVSGGRVNIKSIKAERVR